MYLVFNFKILVQTACEQRFGLILCSGLFYTVTQTSGTGQLCIDFSYWVISRNVYVNRDPGENYFGSEEVQLNQFLAEPLYFNFIALTSR